MTWSARQFIPLASVLGCFFPWFNYEWNSSPTCYFSKPLKLPHFLLCWSFTSLSSFVLLWQDRIYNVQVLPSCMLSFTWCPIPKEDMPFHLTDASCPSWCALQSRGSKFKCPQGVERQHEWEKVGRDHGELEWCPTNGHSCYQAPVDSYHGENGIPMLSGLLIFQRIWKSRCLGEIHPLWNFGN